VKHCTGADGVSKNMSEVAVHADVSLNKTKKHIGSAKLNSFKIDSNIFSKTIM
jgi:hypothetical protein